MPACQRAWTCSPRWSILIDRRRTRHDVGGTGEEQQRHTRAKRQRWIGGVQKVTKPSVMPAQAMILAGRGMAPAARQSRSGLPKVG